MRVSVLGNLSNRRDLPKRGISKIKWRYKGLKPTGIHVAMRGLFGEAKDMQGELLCFQKVI